MAEKPVTPGLINYSPGGLCNTNPAAFMLQDFFILVENIKSKKGIIPVKSDAGGQYSFLSTHVGIIQTAKKLHLYLF